MQVEATISAATLAGKPVVGAKGTLKIYQLIMGANGRIDEKEIQSWPVETDAEGEVETEIRRARHRPIPARRQPLVQGRRSRRKVRPSSTSTAPAATIRRTGNSVRSNSSPTSPTTSPASRVKLRVNSDRENANVWLFLHIAGSAGREAKRIQLDGKSLEVEVPLTLKDMPNMFIEGITVHGAKVHTAVRQILLPPVSKMIEVTLEPAKTEVKPRRNPPCA